MRIKTWASAIAGLAVAGAALTACGSNGSGGSADGVMSSNLSGAPIVIGTICSCSGAQSAALGKSAVGIQAWVKQINDNGGLNGHPVKLFYKDDAGDPTKALQAAKELVEQDKVVAIVGENSVADAAFQSYVEQKKVPVVGGLAPEQTFLVSPDFFISGSSQVVSTYGMMKDAKAAGATKIGALYCAESPVCAQVGALGSAFSQILGVGWTSAKISASQPSYTASCLSMKSAGADAVFLAHNSSVDVRVAADCGKAAYKPIEIGQLNSIGPDVIASPDFEGAILAGANAAPSDEAVPGIKDFRTAVDAFHPGMTEDNQFNVLVEQSWAGAKLFEAAAKAVNLGPTSTSADVLKGLYSLKNETLDGIAPPLNFVAGRPGFPSCYFSSQIKGGQLVAPKSQAECLEPAELSALGKILAAMS